MLDRDSEGSTITMTNAELRFSEANLLAWRGPAARRSGAWHLHRWLSPRREWNSLQESTREWSENRGRGAGLIKKFAREREMMWRAARHPVGPRPKKGGRLAYDPTPATGRPKRPTAVMKIESSTDCKDV